MPEDENGVTISGKSIIDGLGKILGIIVAGAIFYVAAAIPKIQTDIALISQSLVETKKTDEKQWEFIGKLSERVTETREYLIDKGWKNGDKN